MKKVKMIVTAAAIFAVVGSALAFKTTTNQGNIACIAGGSTGTCPSTLDYNTSTSGILFLHCGAAGSTADCNTTSTTQVNFVGN